MTESKFEYKHKNVSPGDIEFEILANAVLQNIDLLLTVAGSIVDGEEVFLDPDDTFVIKATTTELTVKIFEGEDFGLAVFHVIYDPFKYVSYIPGPWENRIALLVRT